MITRRVFSFKRLRFVTSLVDSSFFTKSKEVFLSDLPSSKQVYREAVGATAVFHRRFRNKTSRYLLNSPQCRRPSFSSSGAACFFDSGGAGEWNQQLSKRAGQKRLAAVCDLCVFPL